MPRSNAYSGARPRAEQADRVGLKQPPSAISPRNEFHSVRDAEDEHGSVVILSSGADGAETKELRCREVDGIAPHPTNVEAGHRQAAVSRRIGTSDDRSPRRHHPGHDGEDPWSIGGHLHHRPKTQFGVRGDCTTDGGAACLRRFRPGQHVHIATLRYAPVDRWFTVTFEMRRVAVLKLRNPRQVLGGTDGTTAPFTDEVSAWSIVALNGSGS
jgi:hypothetical protein